VTVADYDNDAWPDILVTGFGRNLLYRNLGGGRFENVAARAGVEAPGWNTAAAFFDVDGDGWLDLYVAQYIDCTIDDVLKAKPSLSWRGLEQVAFGPFGLKGAPDHFFRNVKGRFVDATEEAGMKDLALGFGLTRPRRRRRRRRRRRPLRRQRLRPELTLPERRHRPLQGSRRDVLLRLRRKRRRPGQHGHRDGRRRRRRDTATPPARPDPASVSSARTGGSPWATSTTTAASTS
jgi:hypothetical protein